ncbi:MAG: hypothetical protein EOL95_09185 [Bacteroidia bacterium]|nr:hypothetical protein [Bacteroidia bacterium]
MTKVELNGVNKTENFTLVNNFKGYRNKEDKTSIADGWMIEGSRNVLLTTTGTIKPRGGYVRLGQDSTTISPILSSYDWERRNSDYRNLRAGNEKLQFISDSVWYDLLTGLSDNVLFRYTDWWDNTELKAVLLMVNGTENIYEWSGGATTYASDATTTLTKEGTTTWAEEGFYNIDNDIGDSTTQFTITNPSGTTFRYTYTSVGTDPLITSVTFAIGMKVYIKAQNFNAGNNGVFTITGAGTDYFEITNASGVAEDTKTIGTGFITLQPNQIRLGDVTHTYHGGASTTTLTNIIPNITPATAGDIIFQEVKTVPVGNFGYNSGFTFNPSKIDNIANFKQQLYVYDNDLRYIYISKTNEYKTFTFTTPTRLVGEGALVTLDGSPRAILMQENTVYISASENQWYTIKFTLSSDNVYEDIEIERLKTAYSKGARSQEYTTKVMNDIYFINFEPIMDSLGRVASISDTPQTTNLSDPIRNDFDAYNFEDGSIFYYKNFVYIAIPKEGIVRIFNLAETCWEAPQLLPISRFSVIDGELCGHSYISPITYKLFTGTKDDQDPDDATTGTAIDALAIFSYQNFGYRDQSKHFNEYFVEGYIKENTDLTCGINYEIDGLNGIIEKTINGSDTTVVWIKTDDSSFGKTAIGTNPLGGTLTKNTSIYTNPLTLNKFRIIFTIPRAGGFFEYASFFKTKEVDYDWEILAFGPLVTVSPNNNAQIKQ